MFAMSSRASESDIHANLQNRDAIRWSRQEAARARCATSGGTLALKVRVPVCQPRCLLMLRSQLRMFDCRDA